MPSASSRRSHCFTNVMINPAHVSGLPQRFVAAEDHSARTWHKGAACPRDHLNSGGNRRDRLPLATKTYQPM